MFDPAQVREAYMQIPMAKRRKLADAIDDEVAAFLKTIVDPSVAPLVDVLAKATPDQVQPGPNDEMEDAAEGEADDDAGDEAMARALASSPPIS